MLARVQATIGAIARRALAWPIACVFIVGCVSDASDTDAGATAATDAAARDGGARDTWPTLEPGAWSVIVLPDTQFLSAEYPEIFEAQTQFIVDEREALNVQFVLHVGDVTHDNDAAQWEAAQRAMARLDDAAIPYVVTPGNHDLGLGGSAADRSTLLNAYFPLARFAALPSFGGAFEPDRVENTYHVFETPGGPWLVLAIEFGARDAVLVWAEDVLARHVGIPAIVVTHAYLYSDDTRYDWATYGPAPRWSPYDYGLASDPGGVNDAEEMWQAFIRQHDDVALVLSGHVLNDGLGRLTSEQDGGGRVHQLLANYQFMPQGGAGFLRIMTFSADGSRVDVRTYSPYLDAHKRDPDNELSLSLRD